MKSAAIRMTPVAKFPEQNSRLSLRFFVLCMQILALVCSMMKVSFYQFFHGKQLVLECIMFVPVDFFYERPFSEIPIKHCPPFLQMER